MAEPATQNEVFPLNLTIERDVLLKSLGHLQSIVERRNTIPILANIKLDASGTELLLTVTDMDIVATESVPATIEGGGALTVPAQTFYDIIRKLPEGSQVSLDSEASAGQVLVKAGSAKFTLSYLPADEFPVMAEGEMSHEFSLPKTDLLRLIDKTRFAMSSEETRYYLNGVYFHADAEQSKLRSVATDGHRLAMLETALPNEAAGMPGIIIPRKTVNELHKLFEEQGDEISISLSESKIRFASGNLVLVSKLIDGTFPDYNRVIPNDNDKPMEVDAKSLVTAVDRVSTISTEKTRGIKFALSQGELKLSAQSPESGFAEEEITVSYSADGFDIGFNSRYVLEMLGQLEGDTARFLFKDSNAPALVNDPSDVTALYVIMPMRV